MTIEQAPLRTPDQVSFSIPSTPSSIPESQQWPLFPTLTEEYRNYQEQQQEDWMDQLIRMERLSPQEEPKKPEEVPIEVRNFRFWQKSLWLNEGFRKATKGRGFMGNFDIQFNTRQTTFNVRYGRSTGSEVLVIKTGRMVSERELEEIRGLYGEKTSKNETEIEQTPRKRKRIDKSIQSAVVKRTIQLVISNDEKLSSTYLAIERFMNKENTLVPDFSFNSVGDFADDEPTKEFVGWLAVALLQ